MPEIDLPKGFAAPEDSQEGEEITVLAKIKTLPNGKAKLCSIEGAPYEGSEEKKEEVKETEEVKVDVEEGEKPTDVPTTEPGLAERIKAIRTSQY